MDNNNNKLDINNLPNVGDLIDNAFSQYADHDAFSCLGQTISFAELEAKVLAFASFLQNKTNLQSGDRIAIQLPNIIQFPIAAYAALKCGLVLVNTNPLYTEREMRHQFSDSGAKALVILSDLLPKLDAVIEDTDIETVIVTKATDLLNPADKYQGSYVSFIDAISSDKAKYVPVQVNLDALTALQYTGGTTGLSKGAMLSQTNIVANVQQTYQRFASCNEDGKDIYVCPLPLYHIYAFSVNLLLAFSHGMHNILIPNPRDLDSFVAAIKPFRFTTFCGLNTLFVGLCYHPEFKQLDFSALKLTVSGGTALTKSAANIWKEVTGCTISEGYGLSETSPVVSFNEPGNEKLGSIGKPLILTDVRIVDDHGKELDEGGEGELIVKGPQVMSGYWQKPDATEQSFINGYFRTGDIAKVLPCGRLQIVDRKKDMIIVSGFNVYPNEVEDILSLHPAVIESAVIGRVDERTGERVCAYVVKSADSELDSEGLLDYCRKELTSYKVPKEIHFLKELPKSSVGKVLRRSLRD